MKNKDVLVTGACGFIGSHLTELLVENGYNVTAFDRYNSNNDWGWLEKSKYKDHFNVILRATWGYLSNKYLTNDENKPRTNLSDVFDNYKK